MAMGHLAVLGLSRDPFSNSPDPAFIYRSEQHATCLQQLEIAVRLKRGLSVVLGQVGTGKTTLGRQLMRVLGEDPRVSVHLVLDPAVADAQAFLRMLTRQIAGQDPPPEEHAWQLRERLQMALFRLTVEEGRTVALILDEGQKLSRECLEELRVLLNFETNTEKLLQIVILAQDEFEASLKAMPNLADRVAQTLRLGPLSRQDTARMVRMRLTLAGRSTPLFTSGGLLALHLASGGYPRRIMHLGHLALLAAIVRGRQRVGWGLVRQVARQREGGMRPARSHALPGLAVAAVLVVAAVLAVIVVWPEWSSLTATQASEPQAVALREPVAQAPSAPAVEPIAPAAPAPEPAQSSSAPASPPAQMVGTAEAASTPDAPVPAPEVAPAPKAAPGATQVAQAEPAAAATTPVFTKPQVLSGPGVPPFVVGAAGPPEVLGGLRKPKGVVVSQLMEAIYGAYRERYLSYLEAANPRIPDIDDVEDGTRILFPSLVCTPEPGLVDSFRVRLSRSSNLQAGWDGLQTARQAGLGSAAWMLPSWNPAEGLRFDVLLTRDFAEVSGALAAVEALPAPLRDNAQVLRGWPEGVVFLATRDREFHNRFASGTPASAPAAKGPAAP